MKTTSLLLLVTVAGCEGTLDGPQREVLPAPAAVALAPALDEAALIARGLAFRGAGFRRVSRRYESKGSVGARIVVWASDDALGGYPRIDPDADGSQASLPVGAMVAREVYDAAGVLKKLTFVAQGPQGYNPLSGDLWFAVTDPSGRLLEVNGVSQHGALASCSGCHAARAQDGFLFGVPSLQRHLEDETEPSNPDAGAAAVDAGEGDAGTVVPDAGLVTPDAGVSQPGFDLSNFSVVNLEAALATPQTATFDAVTLGAGQVLVVGRAATRAQFEAFWRVTLGPQVLYANAQAVGSHDAPIINGGEVWALKSAENVVIDGPFAPGVALQSFRRVGAAGWASRSMTEASPGRIEPSEGLHGLRLTEWSDASDFHMEFVELAWFP